MIRIGKISSIDSNNYKASVFFSDKNIISEHIPIIMPINAPINIQSENYPFIKVNDIVIVGYTEDKHAYILGKVSEII